LATLPQEAEVEVLPLKITILGDTVRRVVPEEAVVTLLELRGPHPLRTLLNLSEIEVELQLDRLGTTVGPARAEEALVPLVKTTTAMQADLVDWASTLTSQET